MMTLAEIQDHLRCRVTYKRGWQFIAYPTEFEGPRLRIVAPVLNSYGDEGDDEHKPMVLGIDSYLPPFACVEDFERWLAWRLGRIENHEMREWLKRDGKPIYDPHDEWTP